MVSFTFSNNFQLHLCHLISTIKVYAGMDIAETRLPQDGQISVTIIEKNMDDSKNPDVRWTVSTIYGEKLTLRVPDSNKIDLKLKI